MDPLFLLIVAGMTVALVAGCWVEITDWWQRRCREHAEDWGNE